MKEAEYEIKKIYYLLLGIKESINGGYKSEKPLKITGKSRIDTGLKIKELEKLGEIL